MVLGGGSGYACTVPFSFTAAQCQHGQPYSVQVPTICTSQLTEVLTTPYHLLSTSFAVDRHALHDSSQTLQRQFFAETTICKTCQQPRTACLSNSTCADHGYLSQLSNGGDVGGILQTMAEGKLTPQANGKLTRQEKQQQGSPEA